MMNTNKGPHSFTYSLDNPTVAQYTVNSDRTVTVPGKVQLAPYDETNKWQLLKETLTLPDYTKTLVNLEIARNMQVTAPVTTALDTSLQTIDVMFELKQPTFDYKTWYMLLSYNNTGKRTFIMQPLSIGK